MRFVKVTASRSNEDGVVGHHHSQPRKEFYLSVDLVKFINSEVNKTSLGEVEKDDLKKELKEYSIELINSRANEIRIG